MNCYSGLGGTNPVVYKDPLYKWLITESQQTDEPRLGNTKYI